MSDLLAEMGRGDTKKSEIICSINLFDRSRSFFVLSSLAVNRPNRDKACISCERAFYLLLYRSMGQNLCSTRHAQTIAERVSSSPQRHSRCEPARIYALMDLRWEIATPMPEEILRGGGFGLSLQSATLLL